MSNYKRGNAGVVLCIDGSVSMKSFIENVSRRTYSIYTEFRKQMEKQNFIIDELKIKTIFFRPKELYDEAIIESNFLNLPFSQREIDEFYSKMRFNKLAPVVENKEGFNAFQRALKADFTENEENDWQIIVFISNNKGSCANDEKAIEWEKKKGINRRIVAFIKDGSEYEKIFKDLSMKTIYNIEESFENITVSNIVNGLF